MFFEVRNVQKIGKAYLIDGRLSYTLEDYNVFTEIRDSYRMLAEQERFQLGTHLIIREDYVDYLRLDFTTVAGILNLFKQNLNAHIYFKFAEECIYEPRSCEPLVKMQARKLLKL